jgi:hypothetical protein
VPPPVPATPVVAPEQHPPGEAPAPFVPRRSRRRIAARLAPAIVPAILVFGAIVAMAASEIRDTSPSLVAPTTAATATTPNAQRHSRSRRARPPHEPARPSARVGSKSRAERAVLLALVQAPRGKLPPALIDRSTGLPKTALQARCRRTGRAAFLCDVSSQRYPRGASVRVRYRIGPDGRGVFSWKVR